MNNKIHNIDETHRRVIQKVEKLLNIKITNQTGEYKVDPNEYGGIPQAITKSESILKIEYQNVIRKLDELLDNETITDEEYDEMYEAITKEYKKFMNQSTKEDSQNRTLDELVDELGIKREFNELTPEEKEYFDETVDITRESIFDFFRKLEFRRRYGYFDMTEEEREALDEKIERQNDKLSPEEIEEVEQRIR